MLNFIVSRDCLISCVDMMSDYGCLLKIAAKPLSNYGNYETVSEV